MGFIWSSSLRTSFLAGVLFSWQTYSVSTPEPLGAPVDTKWLGYDGRWSPVTIRVGTPPQWIYVLPNTLSQETWAISPGGCDRSTVCADNRGGLFAANESNTWNNLGPYELDFDGALGIGQIADYGHDSIALNEAVSVPSQIIGLQNSTEFWTGNLGLGVIPLNFTENLENTFLSSLVENASAIPSHSYGYTAGAYYRLKGVPSSLTLGGVDTNRFVPNDATFALAPGYQPVVAVNAITVSASPSSPDFLEPQSKNNPLTLLSAADSALFTIDSSTPFLWLPEGVCDAFAEALNLTYSDDLQLYLFTNTSNAEDSDAAKKSVDNITNLNVTFSFIISDLPDQSGTSFGDNMVSLNIPFAAFSLELSYPFPLLPNTTTASSSSLPYFPLRRATNSSQYVIGRSFLQETYLAVDYERNNFSLSQATFSLDALTNVNLVEITRPANSTFIGPASSSSGLSTGAKAGIGAGAGALALLAILLAILIIRRRNLKKQQKAAQKQGSSSSSGILSLPSPRPSFLRRLLGTTGSTSSRSTAATSMAKEKEPAELLASSTHPYEIPSDQSNTRYELPPSNVIPVEMPGEPVSTAYYSNSNATELSVPEAQHLRRNSTDKAALADEINGVNTTKANANTPSTPNPHARHSSSLPAYEPSRFGPYASGNGVVNQPSDSVSPSTPVFHPTHNSASDSSNPVSSASGGNRISSAHSASPIFSPLSPNFPGARSDSDGSGGRRVSPARVSGNRLLHPTQSQSVQLRPSGGGGGENPSPPAGAQIDRAGSRNSRFHEEGVAGIRNVNDDLYGQYPLTARRYSWEED
ncbi:MAG: hypothetical protein Q9160_008520 [Pyrenula sp. 1 TL-2023]